MTIMLLGPLALLASMLCAGVADPAGLDASLRDYAEYLNSITSNQQITPDVADEWIARLSDDLDSSDNAVLNQSGWLVVMSLLNRHERWDEALEVCDIAIDTAVDPEVRFDRLADRVSILASQHAGRNVASHADAIVRAIEAYKVLDAKPSRDQTRVARYSALSWQLCAMVDVPLKARLTVANELLDRVRAGSVTSRPAQVLNFRGAAAGLSLAEGDLVGAVRAAMARNDSVPSDGVVVHVAVETAVREGASNTLITEFLHEMAKNLDQFEVLSTSIGHVSRLASISRKDPRQPLDPADELGGVPVFDLIQLLAPATDALIAKHGDRSIVANPTEQVKKERQLARAGVEALAQLYLLSEDPEMAGYYRGFFKRAPFADINQLQLAP